MQDVPEYPDHPDAADDILASPQFAQAAQRAEVAMERAGSSVRKFFIGAAARLSQYGGQAQQALHNAAESGATGQAHAGDGAHSTANAQGAASAANQAQERASVLVDQATQRVEQGVANLGRQFQRVIALAREEGEDIWAEAQHLRQSVRGQNAAMQDDANNADTGAANARSNAHRTSATKSHRRRQ